MESRRHSVKAARARPGVAAAMVAPVVASTRGKGSPEATVFVRMLADSRGLEVTQRVEGGMRSRSSNPKYGAAIGGDALRPLDKEPYCDGVRVSGSNCFVISKIPQPKLLLTSLSISGPTRCPSQFTGSPYRPSPICSTVCRHESESQHSMSSCRRGDIKSPCTNEMLCDSTKSGLISITRMGR
mgnify:CR=1 FL=1